MVVILPAMRVETFTSLETSGSILPVKCNGTETERFSTTSVFNSIFFRASGESATVLGPEGVFASASSDFGGSPQLVRTHADKARKNIPADRTADKLLDRRESLCTVAVKYTESRAKLSLGFQVFLSRTYENRIHQHTEYTIRQTEHKLSHIYYAAARCRLISSVHIPARNIMIQNPYRVRAG